jgi:outer membrane receptor protein involved in Fe transport
LRAGGALAFRTSAVTHRGIARAGACVATILVALGAGGAPLPDEILVTAARQNVPGLELVGNTSRLPQELIRLTNHQHVNELGVAAAGAWLSRGDGQENLTAIRSPVLTGPGACGAFLVLENGIPIRPAGFCNVNELLEIPSELADAVEVIRGPSNSLFGSNGLHGTMNVILPTPGSEPGWIGSVVLGPDGYRRGKLGWDHATGANAVNFGVLLDDYDGHRNESGYEQQKAFGQFERALGESRLGLALSLQNLDQETAGFILGKDGYEDRGLSRTNPNPEAFRKASSQRLSARWEADQNHPWSGAELRFFLRHSEMEFLQHFLPGQPREENGQFSFGAISTWRRPWHAATVTAGLDLEFMEGYIEQFQAQGLDGDSAFLNATLPQGWHYDFDVRSIVAAPYGQLELPLADDWRLVAGLRVEYLRYDYDNRLPDGNTRDDGTPCGFGGCRYNRPADRHDAFLSVAPNLGVAWRLNRRTTAFATLSRGFRAPQATELYRLQNEQDVADLDSPTLDSLEAGVRRQTDRYRVEIAGFLMRKRNDIFQDADRNNVSDGRSRHAGIEIQADAAFESGLYAGIAATWARHRYAFDRTTTGDVIVSGNDIDTAPRTLASARIGWNGGRASLQLEGVHIGSYYLDASNAHEYDGHELLNVRAVWRISEVWSLTGRLNNATDERYADRADFAFGNYRYFPGRPREFFIEIAYRTL